MALSAILMAASLAMYFIKDLVHAVIVYGAYTVTMAVVWLLMNTPPIWPLRKLPRGICTTVLMMVAIFRTSRKEEE